jgi:hypothetical protein
MMIILFKRVVHSPIVFLTFDVILFRDMRMTGWILATVALCAAPIAGQQGAAAAGNGAAFGTRNTRDCAVTAASPTPAQFQQAFICETEVYTPPGSSGATIALVSNVNLEFSKGRPYNANTDAYGGIDVTQPVHDARGSYIGWNCYIPSSPAYGNTAIPGKNCMKSLGTHVQGIAFRDTFGNWHVKVCCTVSADGSNVVYYPPPTNLY